MEKESSIEKLKYFLKEMFQFNANDLDFGIYRIYNLKRKDIEHFIDGNDKQCLEPLIIETLNKVKNIERDIELAGLHTYLSKLNQQDLLKKIEKNYDQIKRFIETSMDESEKSELLKSLDDSVKGLSITDELKDKIYNHILGFFEMYYSNGDFGYNNRSRSLYKVPYEADYDGNDTMFHWKHKGSLYIKSANSFNAIKFKLKHLNKDFELRLETNVQSTDEDVARNNNKDTKIKHYKFNRFEVKDGVTRIIFNLSDTSTPKAELYKSIFIDILKSKQDIDKYLIDEEGKPIFVDLTNDFDKVVDGSLKGMGALRLKRKNILNRLNKKLGKKEKITQDDKTEAFSDPTLEILYKIDQKLNSFYIGNDSDYFIHENLQEYLTQEKEKYIKNYVLDDLNSILDGKLDNTTIIIAKAFDLVSSRIIEFLSSIEEFQKKLFTMKKKVVESEYCLTIDNIDQKYYKEILENKAQLVEWEKLYSLRIKSLNELKIQPTLVLDTKYFKQRDGSNPFKDKILSEIENLDERTNGVLINSENYQALVLLQEKYRGQIKCVYIDPPYNTDAAPILYKNYFRHSSWITLLENRLNLSNTFLTSSELSGTSIAIDDSELANLLALLYNHYDKKYEFHKAIVNHYPGSGSGRTNVTRTHEYNIYIIPKDAEILKGKAKEEAIRDRSFRRAGTGENNYRYGRVNSFFAVLVNPSTFKIMGFEKPPKIDEDYPKEKTKEGFVRIYPIGNDNSERVWSLSYEGAIENIDNLECTENFTIIRRVKDDEGKRSLLKSVWLDSQFNATSKGTNLLTDIFGESGKFPYPKSVFTVQTAIDSIGWNSLNYTVLDYFGGSGTTAHAVIKLNANGGKRKYILVEMGTYFDSITKPRIQKIIYTDNWKNGRPLDNSGSHMHIFKSLLLEQYEDVLDSIERFDGEIPDNLPLKYLYKPELNKINSTIDLSKPFNNKIKYGQPTKEGFVDLVETYNYLQGYYVKSIKTYTIYKKFFKVIETATTLVIWRDIKLSEDDSKAIIEIAKMYPEVTRIEVNHDFNILAITKDKILQVDDRALEVNIIHAHMFNE